MSETSISLVHALRQPSVTSPGKLPLLVLLHGVGSNESDLIGLAPFLDPRFLIVSLRAPLTIQHGAYGWYQIEWTSTGIKHDVAGVIAGQRAAERAIDELMAAYDADPSQIYLAGFSQGAILSLRMILSHPGKYAGAVIMSGRLLPGDDVITDEPAKLPGLPIIVVHGLNDNVLPIEDGREIQAFLSSTPVDLTYNEYSMAHSVSEQSLNDISHWLTEKLDRHSQID